MRRLLLSLIAIVLLAGCAGGKIECPPFPIPPAHVQEAIDDLGEKDKEVWEWTNKLLDLCQQLGTCELE
jgi:hypothetical protein